MSQPISSGDELGPPSRSPSPRGYLAEAYNRHAGSLYRYALMVLADHAAAEDAVHQAFAKLAGMGHRVTAIRADEAYLRIAVRNECWRLMRRRRREPYGLGDSPEPGLLEAVGPEGLDHDERLRLEAALRELPPEQREVVHLKVYEGRTFQEIADWLGESVNTVASRYRYALQKLRTRLAADRVDEGKPQ